MAKYNLKLVCTSKNCRENRRYGAATRSSENLGNTEVVNTEAELVNVKIRHREGFKMKENFS